MASSSGSDLEVEVRSGLEEGRIAPGQVSRAVANDGVVDPSGDREFKDLQGREVKMPLRVLEVWTPPTTSTSTERSGSSSTCICSQAVLTCLVRPSSRRERKTGCG